MGPGAYHHVSLPGAALDLFRAAQGPDPSKPIQLEYHAAPCTQLAFQPRGTLLASGAQDSAVAIWDPLRSRTAVRVGYLDEEVTALAWYPPGQQLIAGDARGSLTCWDL